MDGNDPTATLSLSDWRLISPLTLVVGSALAGWIAGAVLKRTLSLKRRDELRLYARCRLGVDSNQVVPARA